MIATQAIAVLAGLTAFAASLALATRTHRVGPNTWLIPASASALFLAFSTLAVAAEGPTGFWPEHTRNLWANQIWFDLLLAAVGALGLAIPEARSVGMKVVPWTLLTLATGSIGLHAMLARLLYLKARPPTQAPVRP